MPEAKVIEGELVDETTSLAVPDVSPGALLPVVSPDEAKAAMEAYLAICEAVLKPEDYQEFAQYDPAQKARVKKKFKKKSAVKKLQTYWGISIDPEKMVATKDDLGDGHFAFRVMAVAVAKNGRVIPAFGGCSTYEERFDILQKDDETEAAFALRQRKALARSYHDVLSTAETRATNRAVMNLIGVGGGEVTADEIHGNRDGGEDLPTCPSCGKADNVRRSQFDDGPPFYCWKKKGGCGAQFAAPGEPLSPRAASDAPEAAKAQPEQAEGQESLFEEPPPRKIITPAHRAKLNGLEDRIVKGTGKTYEETVALIVKQCQKHFGDPETGKTRDLFEGEQFEWVEMMLRKAADKYEA